MMVFPTEQELNELTTTKKPNCVTIYVSHIPSSSNDNPNRLALKNLLREANAVLEASGVSGSTRKKILNPAKALIADAAFWPAREESMALFMHPKLFRHYFLPPQPEPSLLSVGSSFNTAPLLKIMDDNQAYYVLSLNHNDVQLYKGDHYGLKPVALGGSPLNMKQALNIDEYPKWRETHQIAPASNGKGSEASHGQYNVNQTDKNMLLEFFRRVDKRLHRLFLKEPLPLVIAGVGYLQPIYKNANTYPYLVPTGVRGNFEHVPTQTLAEKAWAVIASYRHKVVASN